MYQKILWMGVVAATMGCLTSTLAEDTQELPVLTVLGETYTASELGGSSDASDEELLAPVMVKIYQGIMGAYAKDPDFQVSEEEVKEFCRRTVLTDQESEDVFGFPPHSSINERFESTWEQWQEDADNKDGELKMSESQLREWKITKSLFDRYGGKVNMDQYGVLRPVDAIRSHYAACEARGDYIIHDEALKTRYDEIYKLHMPDSLISEEEGRKAFDEHPAERHKQFVMTMIRESMEKARSQAEK